MNFPRAGVVIPAYNEEQGIDRLLSALLSGATAATDGEFDIVVVCNGCTDATAEVAGKYAGVVVVETPVAGKHEALRLGDQHTGVFPRIYLDADVVVTASDLRALAASGAVASAPERRMNLGRSSWAVRWFYEVWLLLPGVRSGLYGRGVIALSQEGWARIAALPKLMGDDLAASAAFGADERRVIGEATVVINAPRTWSDLIRRRVRAATATAQFEQASVAGASADRTGMGDLAGVLRSRPWLAPQVALFVAVALVSRRKARKAIAGTDFTTWLRDQSSREE